MTPYLLPVGAVLLIIGIVSVFYGRSLRSRWRLVQSSPVIAAARIESGPAHVIGAVEAEDALTSPFSQTPVVYCQWEVSEEQLRKEIGETRSELEWVKVAGATEKRDFWVRDQSGRIRVPLATSSPKLFLDGDTTKWFRELTDVPPHIAAFLESHGLTVAREDGGPAIVSVTTGERMPHRPLGASAPQGVKRRYNEAFIRAGEEITVLGQARRDGLEAAFVASGSPRLFLSNLTGEALLRELGGQGRFYVAAGVTLVIAGASLVATRFL